MTNKLTIAALCCVAACATKTPPVAAQMTLEKQVQTTLAEMQSRDPTIATLLTQSAGYAVFPNVGAAGAVVAGGAFGKGLLFEHGALVGYVEIKQGSVGLELGGQTYAELIVLHDRTDIDRIKVGDFNLGAGASAVVLNAGAATTTQFDS